MLWRFAFSTLALLVIFVLSHTMSVLECFTNAFFISLVLNRGWRGLVQNEDSEWTQFLKPHPKSFFWGEGLLFAQKCCVIIPKNIKKPVKSGYYSPILP
jgi:hypothetical protein